jgi:hypothetical protein
MLWIDQALNRWVTAKAKFRPRPRSALLPIDPRGLPVALLMLAIESMPVGTRSRASSSRPTCFTTTARPSGEARIELRPQTQPRRCRQSTFMRAPTPCGEHSPDAPCPWPQVGDGYHRTAEPSRAGPPASGCSPDGPASTTDPRREQHGNAWSQHGTRPDALQRQRPATVTRLRATSRTIRPEGYDQTLRLRSNYWKNRITVAGSTLSLPKISWSDRLDAPITWSCKLAISLPGVYMGACRFSSMTSNPRGSTMNNFILPRAAAPTMARFTWGSPKL